MHKILLTILISFIIMFPQISSAFFENQAMDEYFREIERQNDIQREQIEEANRQAQETYDIKINYFYELNNLELKIKSQSGDKNYNNCHIKSTNCILSMRINNPYDSPVDIFYKYLPYKEKCITDLLTCLSEQNQQKNNTVDEQQYYDNKCQEGMGKNSHAIIKSDTYSCNCDDGYTLNNGKCITIDEGCKERSGQYSYYRGVKDENGKYSCACMEGYFWNEDGTTCISQAEKNKSDEANNNTCKTFYDQNSSYVGSNSNGTIICKCNSGYTSNGKTDSSLVCTKECEFPNILDDGSCITPNELCVKNYGSNSFFTEEYNDSGQVMCDSCQAGYERQENKCVLIKQELEEKPIVREIKKEDIKNNSKNQNNITEIKMVENTTTEKINNNTEPENIKEDTGLMQKISRGIKNLFKKLFNW